MLSTFNVLPEMNHNEIEAWNNFQFVDMNKIAIWIDDEDDHPRISDDTAGVRLSGLPENTSYLGLTVALSNDSVFSSRIWNNSSVYDGTTATSEDQQKYSVNYNFSGDDGKSQWTVGLNGDLSSASDSHLLSVNYRLYFFYRSSWSH